MQLSTEGIVLKQRKAPGNRRIIVLFTRRYGKLSAGSSITEKGRGKSALLLRPFTYAEYQIFKNRGYYNIDGGAVKHSYYSIGEDIDRFLVASKLIEYLDTILEDEQPKQALFDLTIEFFESITRAKSNFKTLLYAYLVKSLRMQGVMPELGRCVDCGKSLPDIRSEAGGRYGFSVTDGGIICNDCSGKEKTGGGTLIFNTEFDIVEILNYLADNPLSRFEKLVLKEDADTELKHILSEYLSYYLDSDLLKDEFTV